jgi:sulfatase maturation enzyme AslB (radical SAM superfamily)
MISIITTNACNLRCEYCFEHNKVNKNITFETVKKFIDYVADNTKKWNYGRPFAVSFLGGEPLLNLSIIEKTMRYIQIKKMLVNSDIELLSGGATTNIAAATRKEFKDFYKNTLASSYTGQWTAVHNLTMPPADMPTEPVQPPRY